IGHPILVGRPDVVRAKAQALGVPVELEVVDPAEHPRLEEYVQHFYELRQRRGITPEEARQRLLDPIYFGCLMVKRGDADAFVAGLTYHYPDVIRPAPEVFRTRPGVSRVAGLYIMTLPEQVYLFTDAPANTEPTAE